MFDWVGDYGKGLGDVIGAVARKVRYASWEGARSPYGLPVPICYGVTWVHSDPGLLRRAIHLVQRGGGRRGRRHAGARLHR